MQAELQKTKFDPRSANSRFAGISYDRRPMSVGTLCFYVATASMPPRLTHPQSFGLYRYRPSYAFAELRSVPTDTTLPHAFAELRSTDTATPHASARRRSVPIPPRLTHSQGIGPRRYNLTIRARRDRPAPISQRRRSTPCIRGMISRFHGSKVILHRYESTRKPV